MKQFIHCILFCFAIQFANAQNPFVNKPYIQIGDKASATSLRILWHAANENAKWELEHRASKNESWKKLIQLAIPF